MNNKMILFLILLTTFFQVLHCFEEIGMNAYVLYKSKYPKNPRGLYLRSASVLVGLNFIVLFLWFFGIGFGYYLAFYTVLISVVNSIIHIIGYIKHKSYMGTLGAGVFSGIPLGISGFILLIALVQNLP